MCVRVCVSVFRGAQTALTEGWERNRPWSRVIRPQYEAAIEGSLRTCLAEPINQLRHGVDVGVAALQLAENVVSAGCTVHGRMTESEGTLRNACPNHRILAIVVVGGL